MNLSFQQPWWLLLALLAVPLGWLALRWFHTMSRARAWSAVVLRTLLIALVAGMLAGATAVRSTSRLAVIALVDVSESARSFPDLGTTPDGRPVPATEALRDWLAAASAQRGPEDLFGVVVFDGAALAVAAPRPGAPGAVRDFADLSLDFRMVEGTSIAEAIRLASALFPPDAARRLVLVSDGNQTSGDALRAAAEVAGPARGGATPIDVLPLAYNIQREVMVEFVDAPPQAQAESTVTVRVGLRSAGPAAGTLRLLREGQPVDLDPSAPGDGRRVVWSGGRRVELVEVKLDEKTIHRFEAFFEADDAAFDTLATNNRAQGFTVTPGKGAALLVDGVSDGDLRAGGGALGAALRRAGVEVEIAPPGAVPTDLLSLHAYDIVILNNVGADEIPRPAQALLVEYVSRLGGGLLMVGGQDSFGAGGWNGSPVADILPVSLDLPEQIIAPSAAMVIVLDSSGSMSQRVMGGARTQQDVANEAAAIAIETLDKRDFVGVIEFNSVARTVVPLAPNDDPKRSAERVRAIAPGGGTNLYPALAEAGRMLRTVDAQTRHIIVLSDGVSQGSAQQGYDIAARLAEDGVTVSTIAVGDGADTETLNSIAARGRGKFYRVIDPFTLPRIFIKEIRVVSKRMIRESPFDPVVPPTGSPLAAGAPAPWPTLGGLVLTEPRPDPGITYAALAPGGEPLLAHWNVGLGQVAAFTSDTDVWARRWLDWPGYQPLWSQIVRSVARPATQRETELSTEVVDGALRIRLDAADAQGRPIDLLGVTGSLYAPGETRPAEIRLVQTGPGVYETSVPAEQSGSYVVVLTPRLGSQFLSPVIGAASRPSGAEFRRLRSDVGLLRSIAEAAGGRVLDLARPDAANLFDRTGMAPTRAASPLWRTLMVWCFLVFLLDVGTRRVAWDRLITRELAGELSRHAADALRDQSERAATTVSRLRGAADRRKPAEPAKAPREPAPERAPVPLAPARPPVSRPPNPLEDQRRRQESIRAALRAARSAPGAAPAGPSPSKSPPKAPAARPGEVEPTTSGLLAARKRARDRLAPPRSPEDGAKPG